MWTLVRAKPRVFVTDGSYPNCLAAVRALGRAGAIITVGERDNLPTRGAIGFWSRYSDGHFRYPDPTRCAESTVAALADYFSHHPFDAAIPIGLQMTDLFVRYADRLPVRTMLPSRNSFEVAADKSRTCEFAKSVGIRIPRTFSVNDYRNAGLPCVFKHPRTGVHIAHSCSDAEVIVSRLGSDLPQYTVQEFIPGRNGFGYFGFYVDGVERGFFMHERLMQFPIEGGPSVEARSIYDTELREVGKSLLTGLRWHGVAMVEFKRSDRDGEYYLIEVNPKFWGSLDLAVQSGCNFPVWVLAHITNHGLEIPPTYKIGTLYQWVVPNGIKSFIRYPEYRSTFLRHLLDYQVKKDVLANDPLPTLAGLTAMVEHLVRP